ncbi:Detected protein of unknown function [Hibiscus syriacus]|uniref:Uncharacterized protein n=1 Tax=Hibiscus syriacus TaxID=106335 RepID=A0A6A3AXE6_HIBSY|nr:Detected protein of unknown function [Hibiscus syriacus]
MAGVDCNEWGMDIEKWEDDDAFHCPPPHLLPEDNEEEQVRVLKQDTQIVDTSSPTCRSKGFDAIGKSGGECRSFRSRSLPNKMKQSSRSRQRVMKCISIMVLIIAMIVGKKRFLKPY